MVRQAILDLMHLLFRTQPSADLFCTATSIPCFPYFAGNYFNVSLAYVFCNCHSVINQRCDISQGLAFEVYQCI